MVDPGQAFGKLELEAFPSITRDIRDIIRIDPRVSLEFNGTEGFDRISCLGGNDRANTFTVDGIVQADVFAARRAVLDLHMAPPLERYLVELVLASRDPARYDAALGRRMISPTRRIPADALIRPENDVIRE